MSFFMSGGPALFPQNASAICQLHVQRAVSNACLATKARYVTKSTPSWPLTLRLG